jgi:hypothetical protein
MDVPILARTTILCGIPPRKANELISGSGKLHSLARQIQSLRPDRQIRLNGR